MEITRPERPILLWDGECRFCAAWIRRWQSATGDAVDYAAYQEAADRFPQVDTAACARAVQLVLPDGRVLSAAHAVLRALAEAGRWRRLLRLYERFPPFRWCAEAAYRFVAANRSWLPRF